MSSFSRKDVGTFTATKSDRWLQEHPMAETPVVGKGRVFSCARDVATGGASAGPLRCCRMSWLLGGPLNLSLEALALKQEAGADVCHTQPAPLWLYFVVVHPSVLHAEVLWS